MHAAPAKPCACPPDGDGGYTDTIEVTHVRFARTQSAATRPRGPQGEIGASGATVPQGRRGETGSAGADDTAFATASSLSRSAGALSIDLSSYATQGRAT